MIRYGSEEELEKTLIDFINKNKDSEESIRVIRRLFYGIRFEPRKRVKKAFLKAVAKTGIWDKDVLDVIFAIARDDPEPEVRDLAEKAAIEGLKTVDNKHKRDLFIFLLKAVDRRLIYLSPIDVIKTVGVDYARKILEDESLSVSLKELIIFALENIKESNVKGKE